MVEVVGETVSIGAMLVVDIVFLSIRLYLRVVHQKTLPRVSDHFLAAAFFVITAETVLAMFVNSYEIRFLASHPEFPRNLDAVMFGYSNEMQTFYLKTLYAANLFNHLAIYLSKATLLAFFYEVFPGYLRRTLHVASAIVAFAFTAGLLETVFWCLPHKRLWTPSPFVLPGGFCALRLIPTYNALLFAAHAASTVVVVMLPVSLLRWVRGRRERGEMAFALTTLGFGMLSIVTSIIAFTYLLKMQNLNVSPEGRHTAVVSSLVDQNAVFWAATLSVLRIKRGVKVEEELGDEDDGKGLVIEVEQSWSVTVEIVKAWGHGWEDPWERGRDEVERDCRESERGGGALL